MLGIKSSRDFSSNRARDENIIDVKATRPRVTRCAANIHLIRARFVDLYRIAGAIWILTSIHKNANPLTKATLVLENIALGEVFCLHQHRTLRRGAIGCPNHRHQRSSLGFRRYQSLGNIEVKLFTRELAGKQRFACRIPNLVALTLKVLDLRIDALQLTFDIRADQRTLLPLRHVLEVQHRLRRLENPSKRVVILGRNRVKFVVMTPGTPKGHPHKCLAKRVDLLIDDVQLLLNRVILSQHLRSKRQVASGDDAIPARIRQKISRKLFVEEAIDRLIRIDRRNDIVAVPPGIDVNEVFIHAVRIRIACNIQPVPPPPLAVGWACKEAVNHALQRTRFGVL